MTDSPARSLDRLTEFDLVQRTATGMAFMRELRTMLRDAAAQVGLGALSTKEGVFS